MTTPTAIEFLHRYLEQSNISSSAKYMAMYLIDLTLLDYKALQFSASLLAIGALSSAYNTEQWEISYKIMQKMNFDVEDLERICCYYRDLL